MVNRNRRALATGLSVLLVSLGVNTTEARAEGAAQPNEEGETARFDRLRSQCESDPRVRLNLVSVTSCIGSELFFRETFDGNGRTCGSCHPATNNFTLDRAFIAGLEASDPLFVSETDSRLADLERPELLRGFGLIVVNADGFGDPSRFVVRSVSHTLSLMTSLDVPPSFPELGIPFPIDGTTVPPKQRAGWSGDGAPGNGELRDFADGAILQHSPRSLDRVPETDFTLPTDAERAAIEEFMLGLGRQRDIALANVQLSDARAEQGRRSFLTGAARDCHGCHDNAGANSVVEDEENDRRFVTNFSFDIGTESARPALVDQLDVPFDGGFGLFPLDVDGDGVRDAFGNGAFNTPPLIEAADTGPFFHTHGAESIEDAIRFYTTPAFGNSLAASAPTELRPAGGAFILTEREIEDLGRFLRVVNAALNCQIASAQLDALLQIRSDRGARNIPIERGLLELAAAEIEDAVDDLDQVKRLNVGAQRRLRIARVLIKQVRVAVSDRGALRRLEELRMRRALHEVQRAQSELGTGLGFELGDSHVLF